jgi:8-oxo-dGTP pyrophosphatase MutT (NUDIX family)
LICFEQDNRRFQCRAAAVLINQNKVLLHRLEKDNYWALPGGRMDFQELSKQTIVREMFEEIGAKIIVKNLAFIAEGHFTLENKIFHEIGFIYNCEFASQQEIYLQSEFDGIEGDKILKYKWFALDELKSHDIRPNFLIEQLNKNLSTLRHISYKM